MLRPVRASVINWGKVFSVQRLLLMPLPYREAQLVLLPARNCLQPTDYKWNKSFRAPLKQQPILIPRADRWSRSLPYRGRLGRPGTDESYVYKFMTTIIIRRSFWGGKIFIYPRRSAACELVHWCTDVRLFRFANLHNSLLHQSTRKTAQQNNCMQFASLGRILLPSFLLSLTVFFL